MPANPANSPYHKQLNDYRRKLITEALVINNGRRGKAAEYLGIHRNLVSRFIAELKIDIPQCCGRRHGSKNYRPTETELRLIQATEKFYRLTR